MNPSSLIGRLHGNALGIDRARAVAVLNPWCAPQPAAPALALRLRAHAFAKGKRRKASGRILPLFEVVAPFVELLARCQTALYSRRHDRRRMEPVQYKLKEEANLLGCAKRFEGSACPYFRKARLKKVIP